MQIHFLNFEKKTLIWLKFYSNNRDCIFRTKAEKKQLVTEN